MSDTILSISNVSKRYQLGVIGTGTLGGDIKRWWYKLNGKEDPFLKIGDANDTSVNSNSGMVWALQDINLTVEKGDAIGVIGSNGAGKSTLLKLLSRVTKPTTGEIKYKGRLASLLEVGTGFHPELTGRENIFLNGGILGMARPEILRKMDEIVEFSGCERYIDTPVKRYSSGMRVRLGFAVAAFLDPDVLIIDEVLAVGDVDFQRRAIGKMQSVREEEGRTILFVSHNMASVSALCNKGILLSDGKIKNSGPVSTIIHEYLIRADNTFDFSGIEDRKGDGRIKFKSVKVYSDRLDKKSAIYTGGELFIELLLENKEKIESDRIRVDLRIDSALGSRLIWLSTSRIENWTMGNNTIIFHIKNILLNEGIFVVTLFVKTFNNVSDWIQNAFSFEVQNLQVDFNGKIIEPSQAPFVVEYEVVKE